MKELRTISICLTGLLLIVLTLQSKYGLSLPTALIYFFLIIAGVLIFLWAIIKDTLAYRVERTIQSFLSTAIALSFTIISLTIGYFNQRNFNKPTLVEAFYDGDINGVRIDFKTDGTYIFNNYYFFGEDYRYGTYHINGKLLVLDKSEIDNIIETNKLRVELGYQNKLFLFQIDNEDKTIKNAISFLVVKDNR